MAQCQSSRLPFQAHNRREIVAHFNGGRITSDGGALLLREVDSIVGVTARLAAAFTDHRDQRYMEHSVLDLVRQRLLALALGYEDLNDHDTLRGDHVLALAVGKRDIDGRDRRARDAGQPLASPSTLNRLELSTGRNLAEERYKKVVADHDAMDALFVDIFLDAHEVAPDRIVLDLDVTDDPVHGDQEGRFFSAYYDCHCYTPLYIFCGEHLLCARLRRANQDAAEGSVDEVSRIVARIRARWPQTAIVLRGDSGFCRDNLLSWCEAEDVRYVIGLAKNSRLEEMLADAMATARSRFEESGAASRVFKDMRYKTIKSWSRERRVVGKAEYLPGLRSENPRFVVTDLDEDAFDARSLYEDMYCARGDMENRIKEQQLDLFADRTSTATMRANQLRLYFASFAYVLLSALRRLALAGTEMARAQCGTIRRKLLKIGASLKVTSRKIWLSLSESYPYPTLFRQVLDRLDRLRQAWPSTA